jgi:hypothetical protein
MASAEMLRCVALVRTDVGISSQRVSVASYSQRCSYFTDSFHPDEGGAKMLRNVGPYKIHMA